MKLRNGLIASFICLGILVVPASASASGGFFGIVPQKSVSAADLAQMKAGGIESMRTTIAWGTIEPTRGTYDFTNLDQLVGNAAQAGITVLPALYATPSWLSSNPKSFPTSSSALSDWNAMLATLVSRYGSQGSYWSAHPTIPKTPIVNWQIWNEENTKWFVQTVRATDYANLVIQSAATIRARDANGKVMLGGMYSSPTSSQGIEAATYLDSLYKVAGFQSSFDSVAVHPYAGDVDRSMEYIGDLRTEMNQAGDSAKGIYVTEIGWGSDSLTSLGQGSQSGQAEQLTSAYKALLAGRGSLGIRAVYWFAWTDAPFGANACNFCYGTGLLDSKGLPKLAWGALTALIASQNGPEATVPATDDPGAAPAVSQCVVPRLKAKRLRVARRLLRKAHCRVRVVRRTTRSVRHRNGRITSQSKKPSSVWPAGKKIKVVVARRQHRH